MKQVLKWIGLSLLLLIILTLILAPGIVKRYTQKHSPELIGRSVSMDKLRVYWLQTKVRITDFTLFESDNQKSFVSFDTLVINLKPLRLIRHELNMQQLYLSGLNAFVIQEDSTFNFSDLIEHITNDKPGETTEKDTAGNDSFAYHLYDIELRNARFEYDNRNIEDTLLLRNISFAVPYIGWDQSEKSEAGLHLDLEKEGSLDASININPAEGDFDMNISLQQLGLDGFTKLLSSYTDIGSVDGILNTHLEILGHLDEPERSLIAGQIELVDLSLSDLEEQEFFGAESIRLDMRELDLANTSYTLDSLVVEEPYVYFELKDSTNNLMEIFRLSPADSASADPAATGTEPMDSTGSSPLYYSVGSFIMDQGVIDFSDGTAGEPFDYYLSEIEIHTDSLDSNADRVSIFASMLLNERGKLVAETSFEPLSPANFRLNYTITDFQLDDLNIYSKYYMGFPILYGEMFYRGHTEVRNKELLSDNHLIMDHVELGEKGGGLHDLPLKFALYILKDRNDVIDLEIPVRGRTDDPQVSVGQIVWNTLKNLIIRTAAAPYDFLSGLLGVDPEDIEAIEFPYRDTTLAEGIQEQLDLLVELEQIKPSLEIELIYFNDPEKEAEEIVRSATGMDSIQIQSLDPAATEKLEADSMVVVFNQTRIGNVEQYLLTASDSTQIVISSSDPRDPLNVGSRPRFEMRYSMKDEELKEE